MGAEPGDRHDYCDDCRMTRPVAIILGVFLLAVTVPWLLMAGRMGLMMGSGMMGGTGTAMLAVTIALAVTGGTLVTLGLRHRGTLWTN